MAGGSPLGEAGLKGSLLSVARHFFTFLREFKEGMFCVSEGPYGKMQKTTCPSFFDQLHESKKFD